MPHIKKRQCWRAIRATKALHSCRDGAFYDIFPRKEARAVPPLVTSTGLMKMTKRSSVWRWKSAGRWMWSLWSQNWQMHSGYPVCKGLQLKDYRKRNFWRSFWTTHLRKSLSTSLTKYAIILQTQARTEPIKHNSSHHCVAWRKEKEGLYDAVEEKSRHWFLIAVPWHRTFWVQFTTFHTCRHGWDRHDYLQWSSNGWAYV